MLPISDLAHVLCVDNFMKCVHFATFVHPDSYYVPYIHMYIPLYVYVYTSMYMYCVYLLFSMGIPLCVGQ